MTGAGPHGLPNSRPCRPGHRLGSTRGQSQRTHGRGGAIFSALFTYPGTETPVRIVNIDGEPWFVLADLCKVLGLPNRTMVARRLTDDQKGVNKIDTPGGRQEVTIVNESGMYEVVVRSDKPEAVSCPGTDENTALSYLDRGGVFVNLGHAVVRLLCRTGKYRSDLVVPAGIEPATSPV